MAEKVTRMVLKVDLKCPSCYKKVKKILCKFPEEIRDQVYDEQKNLVKITVVCCSPERLRDKLCCKGRKVIKSIEILDPPKPIQQATPPPSKPKPPEPAPGIPVFGCRQCCHGYGGGLCYHGCWRHNYYCYGNCCHYFIEENPSGCTLM